MKRIDWLLLAPEMQHLFTIYLPVFCFPDFHSYSCCNAELNHFMILKPFFPRYSSFVCGLYNCIKVSN